MSMFLRILALLFLLLGLAYLYVQLGAVRIGVVSPLNYLLMIIGVLAIPIWLNGRAKARRKPETAE